MEDSSSNRKEGKEEDNSRTTDYNIDGKCVRSGSGISQSHSPLASNWITHSQYRQLYWSVIVVSVENECLL